MIAMLSCLSHISICSLTFNTLLLLPINLLYRILLVIYIIFFINIYFLFYGLLLNDFNFTKFIFYCLKCDFVTPLFFNFLRNFYLLKNCIIMEYFECFQEICCLMLINLHLSKAFIIWFYYFLNHFYNVDLEVENLIFIVIYIHIVMKCFFL